MLGNALRKKGRTSSSPGIMMKTEKGIRRRRSPVVRLSYEDDGRREEMVSHEAIRQDSSVEGRGEEGRGWGLKLTCLCSRLVRLSPLVSFLSSFQLIFVSFPRSLKPCQ
jgi:hypothetical protein